LNSAPLPFPKHTPLNPLLSPLPVPFALFFFRATLTPDLGTLGHFLVPFKPCRAESALPTRTCEFFQVRFCSPGSEIVMSAASSLGARHVKPNSFLTAPGDSDFPLSKRANRAGTYACCAPAIACSPVRALPNNEAALIFAFLHQEAPQRMIIFASFFLLS